jgi:hypothetical protein
MRNDLNWRGFIECLDLELGEDGGEKYSLDDLTLHDVSVKPKVCKRKAKGRSDTGRESVPVRRRRRNPEGVEDSKDSPRDNASGAGGESR